MGVIIAFLSINSPTFTMKLERMRLRQIILIIIAICICAGGYGQLFKTDFEYLSTSDGLAQNHVFNIHQDKDGFIWLCTQGGLSKYDGFNFVNYVHRREDSTSISSNHVKRFLQDSKGRCWVTTINGLNQMDRRKGVFKRYYHQSDEDNSLADNYLHDIAEDSNGHLWIVHRKGIDRYDPNTDTFNHFLHPSFRAGRFAGCVAIDVKNTVWVTGADGLYTVNEESGQLDFIGLPEINADVKIEARNIYIADDQTIWLALNRGLAKYRPEQNRFERVHEPLFDKGIRYITEYPSGTLAVGTSGKGVVLYDTRSERVSQSFQYAPEQPDGISGNFVYSVYVDRDDNLWIGLFYGLNRINPSRQRFHLWQNGPGINNLQNFTLLVHEDARGGLWMNTMEGLYHKTNYHAPSMSMLKPPLFADGFNDLRSIDSDDRGRVYISIQLSGIFEYDYATNNFKLVADIDKIKPGIANSMATDVLDDNVLWISRPQGLCALDKTTYDTSWVYPQMVFPGMISNAIGRFTQLPDGSIYFVNAGQLYCYNPTDRQLTMVSDSQVISGNVFAITHYSSSLWMANANQIIEYRLDTKQSIDHSIKNGIENHGAVGLKVDDDGVVWAVRSNTIYRILPEEGIYNEFVSPTSFINGIGAVGKQSRRIIFGGNNGTLLFQPNDFSLDDHAPHIVFTGLKIANQPIDLEVMPEYTKEINLSYDNKVFTIAYAALYFNNRIGIHYDYLLEGFDDDWIHAGTERQVTYTNLKPGRYTFKAVAITEDGQRSKTPLVLPIYISAPYYMTTAFRAFIAVLILFVGYLYYAINRRAKKLAREKDLAEKNAQYKTMFLANMSHEIRTPMNAIIGLNRLLIDTPLSQKQEEYVKAIQSSSENLLWIINDILDQAKIESGKYTIVDKPFDLTVVLDQLTTLFSYRVKEKGLTFTVDSQADLPIYLMGDQVRLFQILTNLTGNALKFTSDGEINLKVYRIDEDDDLIKIGFDITDTGQGIPHDKINQIFESFRQLNENNTTESKGTGLGLSIVKSLVNQMDGHIHVKSQINHGTTFTVILPFRKASQAINKEASSLSFDIPSGLSILIVEDTPFNQLLATELLEKYIDNVRLQIAENGQIALEKLDKDHFDLVLMDVKMPVMDGLEATRRIRIKKDDNGKLPILGLTANAIPQQIAACLEAGMNDCVTKPIDPRELLEKISKVMHHV